MISLSSLKGPAAKVGAIDIYIYTVHRVIAVYLYNM